MGFTQWFSIGCCWLLPAIFAHSQEPLRFGAFPFTPPNRLESRVGPLAKAMGEHLNRPVEFRTRNSFDVFLQALKDQRFDVALVQPFDYILVRDNTDYRPLVRKAGFMRAHIVTADSAIQTVYDLRQQVVAFPSYRAAVSLLAIRDLQVAGIGVSDFEPRFFSEHSSCLLAARNGLAKACVTALDTLGDNAAEVPLHTVKISQPMPPILLVIRSGAVQDADGLTRWLLSLNDQPAGRALLTRAYLDQVILATDTEYDGVAAIYEATREANDYINNNGLTQLP